MQIELTLNVSDAHTINGLPDPISNCTTKVKNIVIKEIVNNICRDKM